MFDIYCHRIHVDCLASFFSCFAVDEQYRLITCLRLDSGKTLWTSVRETVKEVSFVCMLTNLLFILTVVIPICVIAL